MTLAELLVSACVTVCATGAAIAVVLPLQRGFAAQPEAAGLAQRTRVVAELISADIRRASLVLPYRIGDIENDAQRGVFYRRDVISLVTEPIEAVARGIVSPGDSRTYHLKQDAEGIWQLMQYDGHASDQPAVEDVILLQFEFEGEAQPPAATLLQTGSTRVTYGPVPPPLGVDDQSDSWGAGENCTIANINGSYASRLQSLGAGRLAPIDQSLLVDGPWCPDSAHAFRFDADLLRVRRVRVHVRLQAPTPFRGITAWFQYRGSAADPARYVADHMVTLDVAPRNIDVAR